MRIVIGSLAFLFAFGAQIAQAALITFEGGLAQQAAWRSSVGSFVLEDFQSFSVNAPISSLPSLGLTFDPLAGGGPPGIYQHSVNDTPFGANQLANFPGNCCITTAYQFNDLVAQVDPGVNLFGLAFWNGDPQGNSLLRIYDRSGVLIGTVTALINTGNATTLSNSFAGFTSTVPIGRLEWEGNAGDGWNHYDGLQATFGGPNPTGVPEPSTLALVVTGLLGLGLFRRRKATA